MRRPEVSVVIPYYDDQPCLTLLLRALDQQRGGTRLEVVVADDGSPEPPVVPDGLDLRCAVVRQDDLGFRAAAARNLGAAAATGELLIFVDGDTLPTAGYLAAMTGMLRDIDDGHGALVVGRRRHADFGRAADAEILAFLRGDRADSVGSDAAPVIRPLADPRVAAGRVRPGRRPAVSRRRGLPVGDLCGARSRSPALGADRWI